MRETALFEPIEDKERIEVLDGPAAFLYGFAAPGGTVNYELKHPPETTLNRVTVGDYGAEQGYAHGDFGGPIDKEGRLAYRINILKVDAGNVGVDGETHKRNVHRSARLALGPRLNMVVRSLTFRPRHQGAARHLSGRRLRSAESARSYKNYGAP